MVEFSVVKEPETPTIGIRKVLPMDQVTEFFGAAFGELYEMAGREGLKMAGMPFARYRGMPTDTIDVEAGVPLGEPGRDSGNIAAGSLPATSAVEGIHTGPYDTLEETYTAMMEWMAAHDQKPADEMWEYYLTDPSVEPDPEKWLTKVVWPVAD